ncbi:MAG: TldD/PmbA family protein [Bacillota bacterium]
MEKKLKDLIDYALDQGVDYVDVRYIDRRDQIIKTEDNRLQDFEDSTETGAGIRVLVDGAQGFAATSDLDQLEQTVLKAISVAQASKKVNNKSVKFAEKEVIDDSYATHIEEDPFSVPVQKKIDLLLQAEKKMKETEELFQTSGSLSFRQEKKIYTDSEGSYLVQKFYESGGGITAKAIGDGELQIRSYPCAFGGNYSKAGYEFIREMDLVNQAKKIAEEVVTVSKAEEIPAGEYDLVIDSSQMTLQIHESIGHPIELDRIFGAEAAFAGTSFLDPEMLDEFQYASNQVNVVADATKAGCLGTFAYDDEGVPAQRVEIIKDGILKNFLTSRDTAYKLGEKSGGAALADNWDKLPIIRMTNINLLPGEHSLDELISEVDYGFYLKNNRSWSIDDLRLNFQFGCEIAYEIKNGELTGKVFKNPVYSGSTPEFWNSCDGIANQDHWKSYGVPNCGKGEPMQIGHVGHGSAPARFRQVQVGVDE